MFDGLALAVGVQEAGRNRAAVQSVVSAAAFENVEPVAAVAQAGVRTAVKGVSGLATAPADTPSLLCVRRPEHLHAFCPGCRHALQEDRLATDPERRQ